MRDGILLGAYDERLPPGRYIAQAAYAFGAGIGATEEQDRSFMRRGPISRFAEILMPADGP